MTIDECLDVYFVASLLGCLFHFCHYNRDEVFLLISTLENNDRLMNI